MHDCQAKLAFDVFDEKETGEVDSEELRNCLIRAKGVELGPDEVNNMIKVADRDGNGTIEFDEVCLCVYSAVLLEWLNVALAIR